MLPKEAKAIIALNKKNQTEVRKNNLNKDYQFNLEWDSIDEYDATNYDCWSFKTADDEKDGILLDLGNQCSGYPFQFHGQTFQEESQKCQQRTNQKRLERDNGRLDVLCNLGKM